LFQKAVFQLATPYIYILFLPWYFVGAGTWLQMGVIQIAVQFTAGLKGETIHVDTMKTYRRSRIVAPPILNLGAGGRRFVSVTLQQIYPVKNPRVLQSQLGRFGGEIYILHLPGFEAQTIQP